MEKPLKSKLRIRTAIFSCSILFIVLILFLIQSHDNGSLVVINVDGDTSYYLLNKDQEIDLGTNIVTIKGGYVYMSYADCPDKICIKQGKINKKGQTITCLPNKITVSISSDDDIDIIN